MLRPNSRRGFTYAHAVQLLGADNNAIVGLLGRLAGPGVAIASVKTLSAVDFFALRDEAVRWGDSAVRGIRGRLTGVNRYDRTQLLVAAHSVIVISAFFEGFDDILRFAGLKPEELARSATEQLAIAIKRPVIPTWSGLLDDLTTSPLPMPSPDRPFEQTVHELHALYRELIPQVIANLVELIPHRDGLHDVMSPEVETAAVRRYEIGYRRLAEEVPEFAVWAAMTDAAAGRATTRAVGNEILWEVGELRTGLAGVPELLRRIDGGHAGERRSALVDQYRKEFDRRLADIHALPEGVELPPMRALYVNPRARIRIASGGSPVATEHWWSEAPVLPDIQSFLVGHLTGPWATELPLVVLGQPGSGKSLLSRALAATLPAEEFLPVRVELRSVTADAPIQDQIEAAVYRTIGERVSWPELVRSAGGALPVVILDGLDELLQASGLNHANYLEQVRDFQRREAERNRPVAVLVSTRIVVADRARIPSGCTVLRLDPFDDDQVHHWLEVWGTATRSGLGARGLRPLPPETALRFAGLAEQPLLLLMLALYDASANALQRAEHHLDEADLYAKLFEEFAHREIHKREPGLADDELRRAVDAEIARLGVVAIAMFNRGAQVITEAQLGADLAEFSPGPVPPGAAHTLVGRFFFIHESQATDADPVWRSFEFLHATFGEFLVARAVTEAVVDLAADEAHRSGKRNPGPLDAGYLHALLSFAVLSGRGPVFDFCDSMLSRLSPSSRAECRAVLRDLLHDAGFGHQTWSHDDYRPVARTMPARHAAFTANLVILLVLLGDGPEAVTGLGFSGATGDARSWRSHALMWESQLSPDDWTSLWSRIRVIVDPVITREHQDRFDAVAETRVGLADDTPVQLSTSFSWGSTSWNWTDSSLFDDLSVHPNSVIAMWLREATFRADDDLVKHLAHDIAPYWRHVDDRAVVYHDAPLPAGTAAQALLEVLLSPRAGNDVPQLIRAYKSAARIFGGVSAGRVLLQRLADDTHRLGPDAVVDILTSNDLPRWVRTFKDWEDVAGVIAAIYHEGGVLDQYEWLYRLSDHVNFDNKPDADGLVRHLEAAFARRGRKPPADLLDYLGAPGG